MNMIEKVARAICRNWYKDFPKLVDTIVEKNWTNFEAEAKVAIEAMKEPTEEMISKGILYRPNVIYSDEVVGMWRKMIEEALKHE